MSAKKQNRAEAVRNAATGYAVVVLAVACFMLVVAMVMAGVRVLAGLGPTPANTAGTNVTPTGAVKPANTTPNVNAPENTDDAIEEETTDGSA